MQVLETLGINLPGFLWHTANFLLLLFLLSKILYRPIVKILDERASGTSRSASPTWTKRGARSRPC
jgi:hypothetical protein